MKNIWFILTINFLIANSIQAQGISQPVLLEVEGAIRIGHTDNPTPDPGTIRYTGADFEGYTQEGWISLTGISSIVDIDNNRYETVEIGDQTWMAENLRVTRYNDGTPIALVTDNSAWIALTTPAYTWYENGPTDYGALYNFYTVSDTNTHNVCPTGWHMPSSAEWITLSTSLGGSSLAGGKMKQSGLEYWASPNNFATNESGFLALPGGLRSAISGSFLDIGQSGYWWSTSSGTSGWIYYFTSYNSGLLDTYASGARDGFSIRCIKN